jgi:hypothetical protein
MHISQGSAKRAKGMPRHRYWLCYELGLRSNPDEFYRWLDENDAKECCEGCATFISMSSRNQIGRKLKRLVDSDVRIYLIAFKEGGRFVSGKRRVAPWAGYAAAAIQSEENER